MDVRKCDRCGAIYEHNPSMRSNGVRRIKRYFSNGESMIAYQEWYDLCPDCMCKFEQFIANEDIFEPVRQKVENAYGALLADTPDVDTATGYLGEILED